MAKSCLAWWHLSVTRVAQFCQVIVNPWQSRNFSKEQDCRVSKSPENLMTECGNQGISDSVCLKPDSLEFSHLFFLSSKWHFLETKESKSLPSYPDSH